MSKEMTTCPCVQEDETKDHTVQRCLDPSAREASEGVTSRYSHDDQALWQSAGYGVQGDQTKDHTVQRSPLLPPAREESEGAASRHSGDDQAVLQSARDGVKEDKTKDHTLHKNRFEATVPV